MNYTALCPSCERQVTTDHQIEIKGRRYTLFHCPYCREKLGSNGHAVSTQLTFATDSDGRMIRLADLANLIAPPAKDDFSLENI